MAPHPAMVVTSSVAVRYKFSTIPTKLTRLFFLSARVFSNSLLPQLSADMPLHSTADRLHRITVRNRRLTFMQQKLIPEGFFESILLDMQEFPPSIQDWLSSTETKDRNQPLLSTSNEEEASAVLNVASGSTEITASDTNAEYLHEDTAQLQRERLQAAYALFMAGGWPGFDYDEVDENERYDNHQQAESDLQDLYFDEQEPSGIELDFQCTDTGLQDY